MSLEKKPKPPRPSPLPDFPWIGPDGLLPATFHWNAPAIDLPTRRDAISLPAILAMDHAVRELQNWSNSQPDGTLPDDDFESAASAVYSAYASYQEGNFIRNSIRPRCGKGCSSCCHQYPLGIHAFEVLHIWVHLPEPRAALINACRERAEEFTTTRQSVQELYADDGWNGEDLEALSQEHDFDSGHRCPFLGEDGACVIHAIRPLTCRMFFAISDPRFCSSELNTSPEAQQITFPPEEAVTLRLERLDRALSWWGHDGSLFRSLAELDSLLKSRA